MTAVLLALLPVACAAEDPEPVAWDFTTPRTAAELGSEVEAFVQADGAAAMTIVFPSGRTITGEFGRGARGQTAFAPSAGHESEVIGTVILLETPAESGSDLRRSAERFEAEWGPVDRIGEGWELSEFLDEFERWEAANPESENLNEFAPVGENVLQFEAVVQDGVEPSWIARITFNNITIRHSLKFDPGVP